MKNLSKMILVLVAAFPLGASAKKPIDLTVLRQSGYQTLIATADQTPKMTLLSDVWSLSPASVLGMIAFADAKQKANKVRAEYDVRDPAQYIASVLGQEAGAALGIPSSDKSSGLESGFSSVHFTLRSAKDLATTYGAGALVINVGTQNWFADTVGKDRYRVSYGLKHKSWIRTHGLFSHPKSARRRSRSETLRRRFLPCSSMVRKSSSRSFAM